MGYELLWEERMHDSTFSHYSILNGECSWSVRGGEGLRPSGAAGSAPFKEGAGFTRYSHMCYVRGASVNIGGETTINTVLQVDYAMCGRLGILTPNIIWAINQKCTTFVSRCSWKKD